jgi:hypothetical protein
MEGIVRIFSYCLPIGVVRHCELNEEKVGTHNSELRTWNLELRTDDCELRAETDA